MSCQPRGGGGGAVSGIAIYVSAALLRGFDSLICRRRHEIAKEWMEIKKG